MVDNRRNQIIEVVKKEFIGPDPVDWEGMVQENGEEIITSDSPTTRYIAGVLFPQNVKEENCPEEIAPEQEVDSRVEIDVDEGKKISEEFSEYEYLEDAEELIDRSNAYKPSAISLTIATGEEDRIAIQVHAGQYDRVTEEKTSTDGNSYKVNRFLRIPIMWETTDPIALPTAGEGIRYIYVGKTKLRVDITFRYKKSDYSIYTVTVENTNEMKGKTIRDEDCYFQIQMSLTSQKGFHWLPNELKLNKDEDYMSNTLLYRDIKNYAIGHGCAADWEDDNGKVLKITTSTFPTYEVKPIVPATIDGVTLSMLEMSRPEDIDDSINQLKVLCDKYEEWINKTGSESESLDESLKSTAERHIDNCKTCLERMKAGVQLLEQNDIVKKAFMWMNEAMLLQQLHYNLPLQKWVDDGDGGIRLEDHITSMPKINDKNTWYNANRKVYGKWRPFQLAFILMNLDAINNPRGRDRGIVDLIWFPTGGGKTEAYLGLSAYTILLRRLKNKDDSGTAILMRYTLRLLTAQQYERAASMICACEMIRRENSKLLGDNEINIGLWVGIDTTPNNMKKAIGKYKDLYAHRTDENPFVMLKCPWCGAQMGVVDIGNGRNSIRKLPGYKILQGPHRTERFVFKCSNESNGCDFATGSSHLPLYIIDDDIYERKPTLLLGTVDKFAMLPFTPQAQGLFGYEDGIKTSSPDLIIQDELHLISGPLGSMVGCYETMIHDLCTETTSDGTRAPKIIASTATISRAKDQCHALYGCSKENVFQFPPSGINAGDSFFAKEDKNQSGRYYTGIIASGSPSDATTAIRLFAALLFAAKKIEVESEDARDPYWTNVGYYNSIRELGQAQTWIKADIDQHLDVMYKRRYDDKRLKPDEYKKFRRYIRRDEELTSRIPSDRVTSSLANMAISYPQKTADDTQSVDVPIDICLASNMISVGLDVQRLGLMTVAGQPKTTSEYIQATSRVGRDSVNAPGQIFILYRPGRPRDKSFYEHFRYYHSKLYCNVEPTSVTPFSSPVRERALHAILIGILRLEQGKEYNENPPKYPKDDILQHAKDVIQDRVIAVDPDEAEATMDQVQYILQQWEDWDPQTWSPKYNYDMSMGDSLPLIYGSGGQPNSAWLDRGLKTPTSMRNVDSSCEARVLSSRYYESEE